MATALLWFSVGDRLESMRAVLGWVPAFLFLGSAFAQPCPPVRLLSAADLTLYQSSSFAAGLLRETDGSLTRYAYRPDQTFASLGQTPGFQDAFYRCTELAPRPRVFPPGFAANLANPQLGSMSSESPMADLTGNGDFAMLDSLFFGRDQGLQVRLGDSAKNFKQQTFYTVGPLQQGVLVADFNEDGKKDVAVVYYGNNGSSGNTPGGVSILLGKGDGTLLPAVNVSAGLGSLSATAFDLNGDGHVDLAVVNSTSGSVSVLFGDGKGNFQAPVNVTLAGSYPQSIVVADVDGDQRGDLVVGCSAGLNNSSIPVLSVHLNSGGGVFAAPATVVLNSTPRFLAAGDINGDGRPDLAVSDSSAGAISILLGNGTSFAPPSAQYLVGSHPDSIRIMDFDLDGKLDIVIADGHPAAIIPNRGTGSVSVLYGFGNGTFRAPPRYTVAGSIRQIAVADFNKDGRPDMALALSQFTFSLMLAQPGGGFTTKQITPGGNNSSIQSLVAGDFNGDGNPDVAVAGGLQAAFLPGAGNGTFGSPVVFTLKNTATQLIAADFNGDGRPDLAVATNGAYGATDPDQIAVLLNSAGGFQAPTYLTTGLKPAGLAAADFNGDGKLDLAVANAGNFLAPATADISIHMGNGNGTFQSAVRISGVGNLISIQSADLNGDGRPDLIAASNTSLGGYVLLVALGNGNGVGTPVLTPTDFGPMSIAVADFGRDGKLDVAVAHCCGDTDITFHQGNGDGTFVAETHIPAGDSPGALVAADFNSDGNPDLAVGSLTNTGLNGVAVMMNLNPAGTTADMVTAGTLLRGPVTGRSFVTAYGKDLGTKTEVATSNPLPNALAGTRAAVTDSGGVTRDALIYFVSAAQVNLLMPEPMAAGMAAVKITSGNGVVSNGVVEVRPVAPDIFYFNASLALPAAIIKRVTAAGVQTVEQLYQVDPVTNALVPKPIDLGPVGDRVFLELYGTGFDAVTNIANVTAVGGFATMPVLYVGPQPEFAGLDQIDLEVPRSLKGRGVTSIVLTIGGIQAPAVTVTIL